MNQGISFLCIDTVIDSVIISIILTAPGAHHTGGGLCGEKRKKNIYEKRALPETLGVFPSGPGLRQGRPAEKEEENPHPRPCIPVRGARMHGLDRCGEQRLSACLAN